MNECAKCENCQQRNSPLNFLGKYKANTDYIMVCDKCFESFRDWIPYDEVEDCEGELIWTRNEATDNSN